MALTALKNQIGSGAATITNSKICFSEVCLSGPMRLIEKFAFALFPFYPNQRIFWGGPPLGVLLAKPVYISLDLIEDDFTMIISVFLIQLDSHLRPV